MTEFWSGSAMHRQSPLTRLSQHHSLLPRNSDPLRLHLSRLPLLTRNDGNSRSCSVIWWTPLNFPPNSAQKITGTWFVPINLLVRKSSSVLTDTLPNSWVMGYLSTSAIPRHMKMMRSVQYVLG